MLGTRAYGWGREYNTREMDRKLGRFWALGFMGGGWNTILGKWIENWEDFGHQGLWVGGWNTILGKLIDNWEDAGHQGLWVAGGGGNTLTRYNMR